MAKLKKNPSLSKYGHIFLEGAKQIKFDTTVMSALSFYQDLRDSKVKFEAGDINDMHVHNSITNSPGRNRFSGGTCDDVMGSNNSDLLKIKIKELQESEWFRKLDFDFGLSNQRRKIRSTTCGTYNFARRHSFKPFSRSTYKKATSKTITINANSGFSCAVSAKDINNYCASIGAMVSILEKNKVAVELNLIYDFIKINSSSNLDIITKLRVKNSGEYMSLEKMGYSLKSVFFRRVIFGVFTVACSDFNNSTSNHMGYPRREWNRIVNVEKGVITIPTMNSIKDQSKMAETLAQALKG